jgi:aspartyl-tRNA(Asn)/glutamyl-tRNA(Gln) amidotransferase subunit C
MISREDIQKLATLSRIDISEEETGKLQKDMEAILGYVSELDEVAGAKDESTVGEVYNVFREDSTPHEAGIYTDALLVEAPNTEKGYIKVKKIL